MFKPISKLATVITLASVIPFSSGCSAGRREWRNPDVVEFHARSDFNKLHEVFRFEKDPDSGKVSVQFKEDYIKTRRRLLEIGFNNEEIANIDRWAERFNSRALSLSQVKMPIEFTQLYTKWENYGAKLQNTPKDGEKLHGSFVRNLPRLTKALSVKPFENPFERFDLKNGKQEIFIHPTLDSQHQGTADVPLSITLPDNVDISHSFGLPAFEYYVIDYPLVGDPVVRQGVRFDLVATVDNNEERRLRMYAHKQYLPITIDTKDSRYIIGLETLEGK